MAAVTTAEIRNIIKLVGVSKTVFETIFTPQNILDNAERIYNFIVENGGTDDSVTREALFTYASDELDMDYYVFYYKWLNA